MAKIVIISPSVRRGRTSHRIALYFLDLIKKYDLADPEIIDLLEYKFPLFNERLEFQESPTEAMLDYAHRVRSADGVIIITPEYNGGVPASLKNATDFLGREWHRKPVVFVTVSDGPFAGTQVIISIMFSLWKLGALTIPHTLRLPVIQETFSESGVPADKPGTDKRALALVRELLWHIRAKELMAEDKKDKDHGGK